MATISVMADRRQDWNDRKENGASGQGEREKEVRLWEGSQG